MGIIVLFYFFSIFSFYHINYFATNVFLQQHRFVLQLVSLAGLHSTATVTAELAKAFMKDGMLAYVNLIQRREKELGVDVLTHQKWSGVAYIDGILGVIQSGSSGSKAMGEGNTEAGKSFDFLAKKYSRANIFPTISAF